MDQPCNDSVVESMVDLFRRRSIIGQEKYGTTLDRDDLSEADWLEHSILEDMDSLLYRAKLLQKMRAQEASQ